MLQNRGLEAVWATLRQLLVPRMLSCAAGYLCDRISCALRHCNRSIAKLQQKLMEIHEKILENRSLEGAWAALGRFLASKMLRCASGHL